MTVERWNSIKRVFFECIEVPAPARVSFLDSLDLAHEMREEVVRLLGNLDRAGDEFLQPSEFFLSPEVPAGQVGPDMVLAGRFRIVRLLGRGGMGEVFEAEDRDVNVTVALKILPPMRGVSSARTERFRRELQLARRVTHPNVCRLFDLNRHEFPSGPLEFLTMEFLNGKTLATLMKERGPLPVEECGPILTQMLQGLQAAHEAGVIHRDLKPGNVMVISREAQPPRVVLMDFGLARTDAAGESGITRAGEIMGTISYMAPEQFAGGQISPRTDLYAVGVIWFEMLNGVRPYDAAAGSAVVPAEWKDAIGACLSANPSARPEGAAELLKVIDAPRRKSNLPGLLMSRRGAIAACASAAAGVAIYRYWPTAKPGIHQGATVVVAEQDNPDDIAKAVAIQLRAALRQSPKLVIWDNSKLADAWIRLGKSGIPQPRSRDWREIALREGGQFVLFVYSAKIGDGAALSLRLELPGNNPRSAAKYWQKTFEAPDQQHLFEAVDSGYRWIRDLSGESAGEIAGSSAAPQAVTTPSWPALLEFTRGEQLIAARDRDAAIYAFTAATRIDPAFTMAWMRLGDVQTELGRDNDGFTAWRKAAEVASERPLTRREDLRFRAMLASDCADYPAAEKLFQEYSVYFPKEWYGPFYRSFPLLLSGRQEEAISQMQRCIGFPQVKPLALMQLTFAYMYSSNRDQAEKLVAELTRLGVNEHAAWGQAVIAHTTGDTDAALDAVSRAARNTWLVPRAMQTLFQAIVLADAGRFTAALSILTDSAREDSEKGLRDSWAAKRISAAVIYDWLGERAEVQNAIEDLRRIPCGPEHTGWAGVLFARLGNRVEAARLLATIPGDLAYPRFQIPRFRIQAELRLNENKVDEGLALLRQAARLEPAGYGCEYYARALADHGHRTEAAAEYRDTLRAKSFQLRLARPAPAGQWYRASEAILKLSTKNKLDRSKEKHV